MSVVMSWKTRMQLIWTFSYDFGEDATRASRLNSLLSSKIIIVKGMLSFVQYCKEQNGERSYINMKGDGTRSQDYNPSKLSLSVATTISTKVNEKYCATDWSIFSSYLYIVHFFKPFLWLVGQLFSHLILDSSDSSYTTIYKSVFKKLESYFKSPFNKGKTYAV